ncbi:Hypothetical protein PHPALM_6457 [Phytophthora palmivora]|uniref:Uncharacterized protein n=1 Tax=Phytophthora palmivora TaxID=4796 RepID=A0A2P4YES3_9STRA|nr:Hypothetical protein PHPALM_6457 [Phytophthora palmivora]
MMEKWDFLTPWCIVLNKRIDYNHLEFDDSPHGRQHRCLVVTLPMRKFCSDERNFRMKFHQVREALMLLSAVAHVDEPAWKYLLSKHCGVNLGKEGGEKFEQEISAKFVLILDLEERQKTESGELVDSDLVEFCGGGQRKVQSGDFQNALQKIAALDNTLKAGKPVVEVEIPVRVLYRARQPFSAIGDRPVEELLKAARAERVIKAEWEASRQCKKEKIKSRSFRCTFVLKPMIADFSNFPVRVDMVNTLSTLVEEKVCFSRVTLYIRFDSKLRADELLTKKVFGQLVTSVFGCKHPCDDLSNTHLTTTYTPAQIGTLVLYCDPSLSVEQFEALCSAMVVSQSVKRLCLSLWLDPTDTISSTTKWKWLAYALFSKRAQESSGLELLSLTSIGSMSVADIEAFRSVLTSEHPEEEILGSARGRVGEINAVLRKEARIKYNTEDGQPLTVESSIASVRTFSDDDQSEWVNAIIPGYGRCLVRRDDLVFEQEFGRTQRGISSLTIGFGDFNALAMDGLGNFLKTVGSSLKVLALDAMRIDLNIDFITQCCPNLEELSLRSLVTDVRYNFTEWHESNQPLPSLVVDWTDAIAVATELQDDYSSFTKSLRRLRVRLNNVRRTSDEHDQSRIKTITIGLLEMLKVNQTLEYVDIVTPPEYLDLFAEFRSHHLKPICRSIPFLMQSKLAFLSTFLSRMPSKTFRFNLDSHVLLKIFEFAATPVRCEVYVHELDWGDKYNEVPIYHLPVVLPSNNQHYDRIKVWSGGLSCGEVKEERELLCWLQPQPRVLQVILPTRVGIYGEFKDPESFQIEFQNTREALALLAAVAHVDYHGWKYLLTNHCRVDFGNTEHLQQEIQVSFVLSMEHVSETDLIELCGVTQRRVLSQGYVNCMERIAAMDHNLQQDKPGFDIEIPVRVMFSSTTFSKNNSRPIQVLLSIQHTEKLIRDEWESYNWSLENQPVESGQLRCTFLLEPMLADLRELGCGPEIAETMAKFVGENVWFSQLSVRAEMDQQRQVRATPMSFRQMMAVIFDATRRSQELANTSVRPVKFSAAVPFVRTFSDDGKSEVVNVVIPGFGRCLVQRDDLVPHKELQFNTKSWGLKSLTLQFAEGKRQKTRKGLPRLLAAIGSSLLFLTIDGSGEELDENTILKNCPNLLELSLHKGWVGVRLNFSEYHSNRKCIPKLRFRWQDICALTKDLSNNRNPFTKCARQLKIRLTNLEDSSDNNVRYDPTINTYLDALLEMLTLNQTLEFLEVTVPSEWHNYGDFFRIHHLKVIKRGRKFPTKSKAAFLSVISTKVKSSSSFKSSRKIKCEPSLSRSNQNGLDRRVISNIFGFATSAVFRQVYYHEMVQVHDNTTSEYADKYIASFYFSFKQVLILALE